jgi:hypothetical protein
MENQSKAAPKRAAAKKADQAAEIKRPENLAQAIIQVMREVKGIEKNLQVGAGTNSYKGVADKDVKKIVGDAMERAGLCILPIEIIPSVKIERWEEIWNGQAKQKQSIFTEALCRYELLHESGESKIIQGYGHGVDSQDKSAGKATTYALKYALLYAFMIPTGAIDDADSSHSNDQAMPQKIQPIAKQHQPKKKALTDDQYLKALQAIEKGEYDPNSLIKDYDLKEEWIKEIHDNYLKK